MPNSNSRLYLYAKLSLGIGICIIFLTIVVIVQNYQRSAYQTLSNYSQMLQTLDKVYLQDMVEESERQLTTLSDRVDLNTIHRGESVLDSTWEVVHLIKKEAHFIYFYHATDHRLECYPPWTPPADYDASRRPWYSVLKEQGEVIRWVGPYSEYITGQKVLTIVRRFQDVKGEGVGLMMVDMSLDRINKILERALGQNSGTLYLRKRNGPMISVIKPEWLSKIDTVSKAKNEQNMFRLLYDGMLFHRPLSYVDWDLDLYLPPETFLTILYKELARALLPLGAICIVALFGIRALLRIVRNEMRIVENGLRIIDHQNELKPQRPHHEAWFVDKTLTELESIRRRYHEYHQALHIDPLTGIFNRRAFDDVMGKLNNGNEPFALVLIDVDHFKIVNDTYGHQTGDIVLQHVASTIMRVLGQGYRIGGDEFAALLLMERDELANNLDQLIKQVRNLSLQETACKVTLSIGVAIGPDSQLFHKADAALYHRKAAGRNGWTM